MNMREKVARAIVDALPMPLAREEMDKAADAVLAAMREPTEEMLAIAVTMTDLTDAHMDKAAVVLEGMPPLSPARQQEGLRAVADMYRDWQAMIDAANA